MHLFYVPEIDRRQELPEEEAAHCVRVLRLSEGDEIMLTDGKGSFYKGRISAVGGKRCAFTVEERRAQPALWQGRLHLAMAPTKNMDRTEWMAEKATEMGIDRIIPLLCRHSERKELKTERLRKILVSAMKQSLKAVMPQLDEMTPIARMLADEALPQQRYIAYCDENTERRQFEACYRPLEDVVVLIGPEGDFSPEEVKMAIENGFVPVTFGNSRLRTETAALYAVAAAHALKQR